MTRAKVAAAGSVQPTAQTIEPKTENTAAPIMVNSGTAFATRAGVRRSFSCVPYDGGSGPKKGSWGGARNWRDRQSKALTRSQVLNLNAAAAHALRIGLPMNRHVTLHLAKLGIEGAAVMPVLSPVLKACREYLNRHGYGTTFLWVRERGPSGDHVHILIHLPDALSRRLLRRLRIWLQPASDARYRAGVQRTRKVAGWDAFKRGEPAKYLANLTEVYAYLIKGANSDTHARLKLSKRRKGGLIIGKRCGTSQNIGKGARSKLER